MNDTTKCAFATVLAAIVAVSIAGVLGAAQDYDRVHSRSSSSVRVRRTADANITQKIPLATLRRLAAMDDEEFVREMMEPTDGDASELERTLYRSGQTTGERSSNPGIAPAAVCNVSLAVVSLLQYLPAVDPLVHYSPQCTRLMRCSGCCSSPLLECLPTRVEEKLLNVRVATYNSETERFKAQSVMPLIVEEHRACQCGCRLKEADCNHLQIYDDLECSCNCTNEGERGRCLESPVKFWDPQTCKCSCRDAHGSCTEGTVFDEKKCQCVQKRKSFFSWW